MRRIIFAALLGATLATPAFAADANDQQPAPPALSQASITAAVNAVAANTNQPTAHFVRRGRPVLLPVMYMTAVGLQGYDVYSTMTALKNEAVELNPMMKGVVQNPKAFIAMKAGVAGISIIAAEKMWRDHHRVAAVLTMVASNAVMGAVAHHNSKVLSSIR